MFVRVVVQDGILTETFPGFPMIVLTVVDSIKQYMVSRPNNGGNYAIIGSVQSSSKTIDTEMGHLVSWVWCSYISLEV